MWRFFARRNAQSPARSSSINASPDPPVVAMLRATSSATATTATAAPTLPDAGRSMAHLQRLGDAVVATITAACVSGADGTTFRGVLATLHEHQAGKYILDLQNVAQFDDPAIEQLHQFVDDVADRGGHVAIASASANLANQLNLALLKHPIAVSRDVMSALEALRRQTQALAEV